MTSYFIRYADQKWFFEPPSDWKILAFAAFEDHPEKQDVAGITRRALDAPVHSERLADRIRPSDKVAVIVEDQTRVSPKKIVLRTLLDALYRFGVPKDNISIVVALGTHNGLDRAGLAAVYGEEAVRDHVFINHDCSSGDLVAVAELETGQTVKINKTVYEADFKIGIGSIFPHPLNGFGGGCKILFPGVADFASILEHHLKYAFRGGSELGVMDGNPFYEEVIRIAKEAGLDFIINSVLDHNDRLYDLVCGDPVQAHKAGVAICRNIITRAFPGKADLTIISAFPYTEGVQIMKPLAPATLITRPGGTVILAAGCTTPLPEAYLDGCACFRRNHAGKLRQCVIALFDQNKRIIEDGAPELNMSMAQALLGQNDFSIILASENISHETAQRLGFRHAKNMDEAIAAAAALHKNPKVNIVPAGGVILPMLQG